MNPYFSLSDKVFDITEKYPELIDLLANKGFENLRQEAMRKTIGRTITMKMALLSKKIDPVLFEQQMIETIEQAHPSLATGLSDAKQENQGEIKIEGILPCPIRVPLLEKLEQWLSNQPSVFDYDLKSASMGVDWIKERVADSHEESVLADVFLSAGFDLFFDRKLMGKFKENNVFEDISGIEKLNPVFDNESIDLKDPKGQYSVVGVVPAIFMVNMTLLGDRPMPESWEDLFKPEFENTIALPMKDLDLFNAILLNIYKNYGEDGLKKLGRGLLTNMHPAQMVKSHVRKQESGAPVITVMPYFFTQMIGENSPFKPVWPKEGAIISPIFLLTKKATKEKSKPFVDFIFSKEVGELMCASGKFPSTHPEVENHLSKDQNFMWLGWDFINSHDIGSLLVETEKLFFEGMGGEKE
jgi:ABC-type Fe3+ transport system substrate-binding protein